MSVMRSDTGDVHPLYAAPLITGEPPPPHHANRASLRKDAAPGEAMRRYCLTFGNVILDSTARNQETTQNKEARDFSCFSLVFYLFFSLRLFVAKKKPEKSLTPIDDDKNFVLFYHSNRV